MHIFIKLLAIIKQEWEPLSQLKSHSEIELLVKMIKSHCILLVGRQLLFDCYTCCCYRSGIELPGCPCLLTTSSTRVRSIRSCPVWFDFSRTKAIIWFSLTAYKHTDSAVICSLLQSAPIGWAGWCCFHLQLFNAICFMNAV